MADPFDEFEFKPLTEGLGFHRAKEPTPKKREGERDILQELQSPLPRKRSPIAESTAVETVFKGLEKSLDFETPSTPIPPRPQAQVIPKPAIAAKPEIHLEVAPWSMGAFCLDAVVILAMALSFLICFVLVTRVDLVRNLAFQVDGNTLIFSLVGLYWLIGWMYYIACRGFIGFTLGEWAYDLQVGDDSDRNKMAYMGKVILRGLIHQTVVIPLASFITKRDYAGEWVGLSLYRR